LANITTTTTTTTIVAPQPQPSVVSSRNVSSYHQIDGVEPLGLVRKGRHVMISMKDGVPCVSTRLSTAFFQGYTFTKRPLQIGEQYLVQITKTSQLYVGSLSFGVTCCDPNSIAIGELPDDPNQLVDRREYWVMSRNVAEDTKPGDLLVFSINHNGNFIPSRFCSFGRMEYHRTVVFIQTFVPCCVLISVFFFVFQAKCCAVKTVIRISY